MNFNNYTTKSQETIQLAQQLAQGFGHNQIENEHIFKALTQVDENVLPFLLKKLNININVVNQIIDKQLDSLPKVSGAELMISREASKSLNEASIIAKEMKDDYDSIITEVDVKNIRSLNAHKSVGFKLLKKYVSNNQLWEIIILDL